MRVDAERPVLVQITPPGHGGVVDYVHCLAAEWEAQGISSHVLSLSDSLAQQHPLADRIADLVDHTRWPCSVVLHYSGYGYGHRGLCFWLLDELRSLRQRHRSRVRLVVVFHELFASGPPWRSAFWLSPLQSVIAARLARMCDVIWTNTEHHGKWLQSVSGSHKTPWIKPVFSNVGEPEDPQPAGDRREVAIVFGSQSTRQRAFDALRGHEPALRKLGVEELIEIGSGSVSASIAIPRRNAGRLEIPELRALLLQSRFGLLDYPSQFLGKSSVFAAYAAHGCVALDTCRPGPDTDRLVAGIDYLSLPQLPKAGIAQTSHAVIATRAAHWYADHRLSDQARQLLALATIG